MQFRKKGKFYTDCSVAEPNQKYDRVKLTAQTFPPGISMYVAQFNLCA